VRGKLSSSDVFPLITGLLTLAQWSSLGPLLFSLYVAQLSAVINSFGVVHHQYANDTQLYITVSKAHISDCYRSARLVFIRGYR